MEVQIKPLTVRDIEWVMRLDAMLFEQPFSKQTYHHEIRHNPHAYFFKLMLQDERMGFAGIQILLEMAEVITIGIDPQYQNQGYGQQLLRYLIDFSKQKQCKKLYLEVNVHNNKAIHLYEKEGFIVNRIRPHYYGQDDAYEMIKEVQ